MTDEDRQLLLELRRMTEACGAFCAGVMEHGFSRHDQLALSDWLADRVECIRERGLRTPVVIEGEGVSPVSRTGEAVGARAEPSLREHRSGGYFLIGIVMMGIPFGGGGGIL